MKFVEYLSKGSGDGADAKLKAINPMTLQCDLDNEYA